MRPHRYERIFNIRNRGLRDYLDSDGPSGKSLRDYADRMQDHPHPVVIYGASWALAESGLFRDRPRKPRYPHRSLEQRFEDLDRASKGWIRSIEAFDSFTPSVSGKKADQQQKAAHALAWRARHAAAQIANMKLCASFFAGELLRGDEQSSLLEERRLALRLLAKRFLTDYHRPYTPGLQRINEGLLSETACGIVGQYGKGSHIVIPASVRRDLKGTDFLAVSTAAEEGHPRLNMQVKTTKISGEPVRKDHLMINGKPDLQIYDHDRGEYRHISATLQVFSEDPGSEALHRLGTNLEYKINQFATS